MDSKDNLKLANVKDVPSGESIIVKGPDGQEIALFNCEGKIYALNNTCPHMGGPLGDGVIDECIVTCPWHGWQFDVRTGACENMPGEDAIKIDIEVHDSDIYLTKVLDKNGGK